MIGVTISSQQKDICLSKEIKTVLSDFTKFDKNLVGIADHIITIGTFEHIVATDTTSNIGGGISLNAYKAKANKVSEIFSMYKQYFKAESKQKKILCTVLHQNKKNINDWAMTVLNRGGASIYFLDDENYNAAYAAKKAGYNVTYWKDYTKHYYMATVLDKKHFGRSSTFLSQSSIILFILGLLNPYFMYFFWYSTFGCWMYMFDGKYHFASNPKYTLEEQNNIPCPLYYGVFELKE